MGVHGGTQAFWAKEFSLEVLEERSVSLLLQLSCVGQTDHVKIELLYLV